MKADDEALRAKLLLCLMAARRKLVAAADSALRRHALTVSRAVHEIDDVVTKLQRTAVDIDWQAVEDHCVIATKLTELAIRSGVNLPIVVTALRRLNEAVRIAAAGK